MYVCLTFISEFLSTFSQIREALSSHLSHGSYENASPPFPLRFPPCSPVSPQASFHILVPPDSAHPGAGSFIIDNAFDEEFITTLIDIFERIPVADAEKVSPNTRRYFSDTAGIVHAHITHVLSHFGKDGHIAFVHMRYLNYAEMGGSLAPHVDLARTDEKGLRSNFTFIIYLTTCEEGGETAIVTSLNYKDKDEEAGVLAKVRPMRGRLFVFPHLCPHEGCAVVDTPKLLLRGELS